VVVSRQAIALEGDPSSTIALPPPDRWAEGVDASYKRSGPNDLSLVPLAAALKPARAGEHKALAVAFDASIPYRIVVEVLFTAGQSGYDSYYLLARTAAGFGAIVIRPPRIGRLPQPPPPALNLAVFIVSDGIAVKTSSGNVGPGCTGALGPGLAVPRGAWGHDFAGLRACAASVRAQSPAFATETQATLTANPNVPFGEIVAAMDALREEPSGRAGFPDIHFGVAR
jgi:biopolymer transport protein ExbD